MDAFDLKGKTALVTGASRGIGEAIAKTLAAHGAEVILTSRKLEGLRRVEDEIVQAGGKAESIACHTGEMAQIEAPGPPPEDPEMPSDAEDAEADDIEVEGDEIEFEADEDE